MKSVIVVQIGLIVLGAFIISIIEARPFGEALYFAFITGLTVGYGDIVATTAIGQVISVLFGLVGLLLTGLVVAVAVRALEQAIWGQSKNASAACSGWHGAQAYLLRPAIPPQTALRIQKAH